MLGVSPFRRPSPTGVSSLSIPFLAVLAFAGTVLATGAAKAERLVLEVVAAEPGLIMGDRPGIEVSVSAESLDALNALIVERPGRPFAIRFDDEVVSTPRIHARWQGALPIASPRLDDVALPDTAAALRAGTVVLSIEPLE